jgi:hypothetical protein
MQELPCLKPTPIDQLLVALVLKAIRQDRESELLRGSANHSNLEFLKGRAFAAGFAGEVLEEGNAGKTDGTKFAIERDEKPAALLHLLAHSYPIAGRTFVMPEPESATVSAHDRRGGSSERAINLASMGDSFVGA